MRARAKQIVADLDFDIEVRDARHLTNIAAALRACSAIDTVERARG